MTCRCELLLSELLDLGKVIVALPHPQPQLGVGPTRLLGRRDRFSLTAIEFPVQTEY